MKRALLLLAVLLLAGCIRESPKPTTSTLPYLAPLEATTTTQTDIQAVKTTTQADTYRELYENLSRRVEAALATTTTSTTTTSTTTSTLKKRKLLVNVMPSRLKIDGNWTGCTKNWDCMLVADCCGWEYGFKYTINEWSALDFERYRSDFCSSKDHRGGCGWATPKTTQARCESGKCVVSYGGFVPDDLQDENFTYTYDWMHRLDKDLMYNDSEYA
jgi:hypothetical protein